MGLFQQKQNMSYSVEEQRFDIVKSFCLLDPNRQSVVCDQLFYNDRSSFKNTVSLLFPQAHVADSERLEKFLRSRIKR